MYFRIVHFIKSVAGWTLRVNKHVYLAAELELKCKHFTYSVSFYSSSSVKLGKNEQQNVNSKLAVSSINMRLVYGLHAVGKGKAARNIFMEL
jgi:hypothetical protein